MPAGEDFSWLRFICTCILGLIIFAAFAEVLTVLFYGIAALELVLHLPSIFSVLICYQAVVIVIAVLSIVAIKKRHTTAFYPMWIVVVCLCYVLYDVLS